jgi:hypothetical protein
VRPGPGGPFEEGNFVFRYSLTSIAGILVGLSLVQPAYAGPKFTEYPVRKASDCAVKVEKAGLVIGVQPIEDLKDQKIYFDSDLTSKGIIPVYVVLENGSSEDSFLFDKIAFQYGTVDAGIPSRGAPSQAAVQDTRTLTEVQNVQSGGEPGHRLRPRDPGKRPEPGPPVRTPRAGAPASHPRASGTYVNSNSVDSANLAFALVDITFAIVAMRRAANAEKIQQYMLKNELQSNTLSPGRSVHGFLYIPVPRNGLVEKTRLLIPITKAGTDETFHLSLDF